MDNIQPLNKYVIAHRGYHGTINGKFIAENSLSAVKEAVRRGYGVELDTRYVSYVNEQGEVVEQAYVVHDANLKRVLGLKKKMHVSELTEKNRQSLPLAGTNEIIPTLREYLAVMKEEKAEDKPLLLEVKTNWPFKTSKIEIERHFKLIRDELKDYHGIVYIQSFDPQVIKYLKHDPTASVGLLVAPVSILQRALHYFKLIKKNPFKFIAGHKLGVSTKIVEQLNKNNDNNGLLLDWTIRKPGDANKSLAAGHGIIFEGFDPKTGEMHSMAIPKSKPQTDISKERVNIPAVQVQSTKKTEIAEMIDATKKMIDHVQYLREQLRASNQTIQNITAEPVKTDEISESNTIGRQVLERKLPQSSHQLGQNNQKSN